MGALGRYLDGFTLFYLGFSWIPLNSRITCSFLPLTLNKGKRTENNFYDTQKEFFAILLARMDLDLVKSGSILPSRQLLIHLNPDSVPFGLIITTFSKFIHKRFPTISVPT